jgi:hypothetical protein
MPKDKAVKDEESKEKKKKVVVVEEVSEEPVESPKLDEKDSVVEDTPKKEEPKVEDVTPVVDDSVQEVIMEEREKTNYLWIIIPTALLIGALVGGLITYFSGLSKINDEMPTPTPMATITPQVEPTPTASSSASFKREELKIQVLNGSGVSGAAGKAKTLLESLGYKDIDTGNASMSDLAQTEVAVKDTAKDFIDLIIKDLSKNYSATESSKSLSASSKFDVVITLGKK